MTADPGGQPKPHAVRTAARAEKDLAIATRPILLETAS